MGWIGSFLSGRLQKVVLEGKSSSSAPVLSGVPQGSVLGPVLFLIYINDLPKYGSNSTVRLFADDTLLYLTIHNSSDCTKLQDDLNNLQKWESDWQMPFHPEKCEVIHITTKKYPIIRKYTLHGHTLLSVPQIKYLGVHISQDLKDKDYCPIEIIKGLTDKGQFQYLTKLMGPQEGTYLYATQFHSLR